MTDLIDNEKTLRYKKGLLLLGVALGFSSFIQRKLNIKNGLDIWVNFNDTDIDILQKKLESFFLIHKKYYICNQDFLDLIQMYLGYKKYNIKPNLIIKNGINIGFEIYRSLTKREKKRINYIGLGRCYNEEKER